MKKKIALLFGGRSVERDISVITAVQTFRALDERKYEITPIFIFEGDFYTGNLKTLKDFAPFCASSLIVCSNICSICLAMLIDEKRF